VSSKVLASLAAAAAAYPNFVLKPETIQLYVSFLADIDDAALDQAMKTCIARGKFFPTIAEIREAAANLTTANLPAAAEAWGEVLEQMRRVGSYRQPEFSNPVISRVVSYFGWRELCISENLVADRARFLQAYEAEVQRGQETLQLLPETRQAIQAGALASGVKLLAEKLGGK